MEQDDKVQSSVDDADELKAWRMVSRRDFLVGLRKWSAAVIGVAVAGAVFLPGGIVQAGWVNGRGGGGGWINGGGGGGGWVNRGGGGGGGSWVNRRGY